MKQKDAVFTAITNVLSENGIPFTSGSNVNVLLTKEYRAQVTDSLVSSFQAGEIDMDAAFAGNIKSNTPKLRAYVSGLISNWVRKDTRLNGNIPYAPKAPGSRKGYTDPQLKALRTLHSQAETDEDRDEIQGYIDARIVALDANKVSSKKVDVSQLPEALAAKFNL
jgi:hypothetical protein